jgi:hypothetical protein
MSIQSPKTSDDPVLASEAASPIPDDAIRILRSITESVFGQSTISVEQDPETGEVYYVVKVNQVGDEQVVHALCDRWHERIVDELPDFVGRFILDVQFV